MVPKRCFFFGRQTLELGVSSAVMSYNDGASGLLNVFHLIKSNLVFFENNTVCREIKTVLEKWRNGKIFRL